jgi:hypothetical protein
LNPGGRPRRAARFLSSRAAQTIARTLIAHHFRSPGTCRRQSIIILVTRELVEFLKKEDGPIAVEYVFISAITTLGSNANNTFSGGRQGRHRPAGPAERQSDGRFCRPSLIGRDGVIFRATSITPVDSTGFPSHTVRPSPICRRPAGSAGSPGGSEGGGHVRRPQFNRKGDTSSRSARKAGRFGSFAS